MEEFGGAGQWGSYGWALIAAALTLGTATLFLNGARLLRRKPTDQPKHLESQRMGASQRFNTRYFLGFNVALILFSLGLALVPCVVAFSAIAHQRGNDLPQALLGVLVVLVTMGLGLFYSFRKGDLSWLRSYRERQTLEEDR